MPDLSYVGRRTLGHLPVWAEDEDAHVAAEGGPEISIRSYNTPELTARLAEDPSTPDMDEAKVNEVLTELAGAGLCDGSNGWRMTEAGLLALTEIKAEQDQEAGPAFVELNPATIETNGKAE